MPAIKAHADIPFTHYKAPERDPTDFPDDEDTE